MGLLDVEECIQDTHFLLMNKLLKDDKRGRFSTSRRFAGESHEYPRFSSEEDAYQRFFIIVDQYNDAVNFIKNSDFLDLSKKIFIIFYLYAPLGFYLNLLVYTPSLTVMVEWVDYSLAIVYIWFVHFRVRSLIYITPQRRETFT
ncbi:hypothetical protein Avbf_13356 [Armadillidium vulgare]|nr:hypothetical protein Avbf_13356 [Armadillidium vulgare]